MMRNVPIMDIHLWNIVVAKGFHVPVGAYTYKFGLSLMIMRLGALI